ncbi:MAG: hypothetical protein LCH81_15495 [Bacteroidetes bacterium]|nr:hypothetical protein [Bacteroidota bacterium]
MNAKFFVLFLLLLPTVRAIGQYDLVEEIAYVNDLPNKKGVMTLEVPIHQVVFIAKNNGNSCVLLKVKKESFLGDNMFKITCQNGDYSNLQNTSTLIGSQDFNSPIFDMLFAEDNLLIALGDGRMIKIKGVGGTGKNMFLIEDKSDYFSSISNGNFLLGNAKFQSIPQKLLYTNSNLLISFSSKKVLKIRNVGGTGQNMFAVQESASDFISTPGYNYYIGDQAFNSIITDWIYENNETLIAFYNKKLLKIKNDGGSGHNMFAITETTTGFNSLPNYNYHIGNSIFKNGRIVKMEYIDGRLFVAFSNKLLLKIKGTGGNGENMLAISEISNGFQNVSGYSYYEGYQNFKGNVVKLKRCGNRLAIAFDNGKIIIIKNLTSTGSNMFAIKNERNEGKWEIYSGTNYPYPACIQAATKYNQIVTDIDYYNGGLLFSFDKGSLLFMKEDVINNYHQFSTWGVSENNNNFTPSNNALGQWYLGDQVLNCY